MAENLDFSLKNVFIYSLGNTGLENIDKILALPQCISILYWLGFCIGKKKVEENKKMKERETPLLYRIIDL